MIQQPQPIYEDEGGKEIYFVVGPYSDLVSENEALVKLKLFVDSSQENDINFDGGNAYSVFEETIDYGNAFIQDKISKDYKLIINGEEHLNSFDWRGLSYVEIPKDTTEMEIILNNIIGYFYKISYKLEFIKIENFIIIY